MRKKTQEENVLKKQTKLQEMKEKSLAGMKQREAAEGKVPCSSTGFGLLRFLFTHAVLRDRRVLCNGDRFRGMVGPPPPQPPSPV